MRRRAANPGRPAALPRLLRGAAADGRAGPSVRPAHAGADRLLCARRRRRRRLHAGARRLEPRRWPGSSTGAGRPLVLLRRCARSSAGAMRRRGAAARRRRDPWLVVCAALAGAFQPPVGACMRALWPVLLRDADQRHAAYATEGVAARGRLHLRAAGDRGRHRLVVARPARSAACAVFTARRRPRVRERRALSRRWRPSSRAPPRRRRGTARPWACACCVAVFALCGLAIGAVEVCVPAALDADGPTAS